MYQRAADSFTALNTELLVELPHIFQTRTEFFDPLFKVLLEVYSLYTKHEIFDCNFSLFFFFFNNIFF